MVRTPASASAERPSRRRVANGPGATMLIRSIATAAALLLAIGTAGAQPITGAGATFPAPLYQKWGEAAREHTGLTLNYQAIGSGGGINQITNRTVLFGASDANLSADRLEAAKLLQFPTVLGSIVLVYSIPGVEGGALKLTGELVADMFLGRIRRWNDPRLVALNRDVALPNLPVAPVYRADGSGTTFQFAGYLSLVSEPFRTTVGQGTSVPWKAGTGGRGNAGVAGLVRQTRGAIGYVEHAYAQQNGLAMAQLRNRAGAFIFPTEASFQAAAASADWLSDPTFGVSLLDQPGEASWPIVAPTYILLPKNPTDAASSRSVLRFFDWAYAEGDRFALELGYIPLPGSVKDVVRQAWAKQIRGPNGEAVWTGRGP